jgi:ADP-heptose:LPS heptosyltransferase
MAVNNLIYHRDCKYFRGDAPCSPHKKEGVHCIDCQYYKKNNEIILIIKLGAIGDVIRTTPLIHKIHAEKPNAIIWWLTEFPEILSGSFIDKIIKFDFKAYPLLNDIEFSWIINLDKDLTACGLIKQLHSNKKSGFTLSYGKPEPLDNFAENKFLTGLFDDVNKANKKSYLEEIFEICGWEYSGEKYILDYENTKKWNIPNEGKPIIGLNTGCGSRWLSRLWDELHWEKLIKLLQKYGYFPLILGGVRENEKNINLSNLTGAYYPGYFPLNRFISLVNQCDMVVTVVTMALHIAIALEKEVVLLNNIFNPSEFELYGRGKIVEPDKPCKCFFSPECINPQYFCMNELPAEKVYNAVNNLIKV